MSKKNMFELGDRVRENITGFTGIAVGRCEYLWGCIQYEVKEEEVRKDGKITDFWFDETRLTLVATAKEVAKGREQGEKKRKYGHQTDAPPCVS